jgi:hypothetical protein
MAVRIGMSMVSLCSWFSTTGLRAMIKPYVRKRLISRRDLLYTLYGFASFATLVGCGANAGSGNKNTISNNKNTIGSNSGSNNSKSKLIRLGFTSFGDLTRAGLTQLAQANAKFWYRRISITDATGTGRSLSVANCKHPAIKLQTRQF